jgi:hypothetical protein
LGLHSKLGDGPDDKKPDNFRRVPDPMAGLSNIWWEAGPVHHPAVRAAVVLHVDTKSTGRYSQVMAQSAVDKIPTRFKAGRTNG